MKTTIKTLLIGIQKMPRQDVGICGQPAMIYLSPKAFHLVRKTMAKWPKYSGDYDYPVPSVDEGRTACQCFHENFFGLWEDYTEYGALRRELLDWLIEQPELDVPLYKVGGASDTERPVFNIKE